jgi:hypothetical protein
MRLVGEPACESNSAERVVADAHQMSGEINPAHHEIGVRSLAKGLFERAREVSRTSLCDAAEIRDQDASTDVCVDVLAHASRLPREQGPLGFSSVA